MSSAQIRPFGFAQAKQAWTIAKIELRRAFFAKRGLWVYLLALLPSCVFFGHGLDAKLRIERLSRNGLANPAFVNSVQQGETVEDVKARVGKPASEYGGTEVRRVRQRGANSGTTTQVIEPGVEGRYVRVNISRPTYNGERIARIYEFEAYGADGRNLALNRPATGSQPCSPDRTPDKAV